MLFSTQGPELSTSTQCHSPSSVVDDLLDNTTNVTVSLGEVVVTETSWVLVQVRVGLEDTTVLPLRANNTSPVCPRRV